MSFLGCSPIWNAMVIAHFGSKLGTAAATMSSALIVPLWSRTYWWVSLAVFSQISLSGRLRVTKMACTPDYSPLTDDIEEVDPAFRNMLTHLIRLPTEDDHQQFALQSVPLSQAALNRFEEY